jgi:hypothetical protein
MKVFLNLKPHFNLPVLAPSEPDNVTYLRDGPLQYTDPEQLIGIK